MINFFLFLGLALLTAVSGSAAFAGDFRPYSLHPPAGLKPNNVPQFVTIGFDDNGYSGATESNGKGGMKWILDFFRDRKNPPGKKNPGTYDAHPCRVSFYMTAALGDTAASENNILVKKAWRQAWEDGHEIGNHSYSHSNTLQLNTDEATWISEMNKCNSFLAKPYQPDPADPAAGGIGINPAIIFGFRTPFLTYTFETFTAVQKLGFLYDSSIVEGWQDDQNGSNYCWPYTLDQGSPGDSWSWAKPARHRPRPIGRYNGLWEFPLHPLIVPADDKCREYDFPAGLQKKIKTKISWFDEADGKIPCFDYNLFYEYGLNRKEVLAVLKYSFDLRYNGNRAPFQLGGHSDIYSNKYPISGAADYLERQWVIEQFVDYVLAKPDTRIVPARYIIQWCRNPIPL